jgi:Flp pilus assembly protein TadB
MCKSPLRHQTISDDPAFRVTSFYRRFLVPAFYRCCDTRTRSSSLGNTWKMTAVEGHTRWQVFLGTVRLDESERRSRRWMIRLCTYSFFALFLVASLSHLLWAVFVVSALFVAFIVLVTAPAIRVGRRRREANGLPTVVPKSERSRLRDVWRPRWSDYLGSMSLLLLGVTALAYAHGRPFTVVLGVIALALGVGYLVAIALWIRWKRSQSPMPE